MNDCKACGKPFHNPKHPNQKFCSIACRGKGCTKSIQVVCEACGRSLSRTPSTVYLRNFCNVKCQGEWRRKTGFLHGNNSPTWRGGHTDYRGPNWERQRRKALKRDNYTCQHCGATDNLQVHHLKPYQLFATHVEANDISNLLTLCMICHTAADWTYRHAHPEIERLLPDTKRIHMCQECGKPFEAKGPNARRCDACWQRTCERCGKTFRPKLWNEKNKFCSRICAGTSKRVLSA